MKLSFVTLTLLLLTFSVLLASNSSGQNINKTAVSITLQKGSLKQVFAQIEQQTPFRFAYPESQINAYNDIRVTSGRRTVANVLEDLFSTTKLDYSVKGNTIIVLENPNKVEQKYVTPAPINGSVKNSSGEPLEGVSVFIKDTKTGTTTNTNGLFTLDVTNGDILVFSRVGYVSKEITIRDQSSIEVILTALEGRMDEIVVVGYGTQKRENVTGAVAQVQMDKVLGDRPITSLGAALQGAVAGFTTSSSVVPGEGNQFNIR
ncbi:MAG TPA: carboxypeptidase-like regulatory domain-containing protein, partial [Niabella sp.]|nr:carboxypeptidase-like regulatory domain-containing protein [Niabella sp.]